MSRKDDGLQRSHDSRRHVLRGLILHLAACAVVVGALAWVIDTHVEPLAAPPEAPPPGLHLSWAGQPIRGYVEDVNVQVSGCQRPALVLVELYPRGDRPLALPPAGKVAFAVSGEWASRMSSEPLIYFKRAVEGPRLPLGEPFDRTIHQSSRGALLSVAYSFLFDPRAHRDIDVAFGADWLAPREGHDSCWLNLPALFGGGGAVLAANEAIGHPGWAKEARSVVLYSAGNYVKDQTGAVSLDPSDSLPLPTTLDSPSWGCGSSGPVERNCQAFAALELPGAAMARTSQLLRWTRVEGVLIAFVPVLLLAIGQILLGLRRFRRIPDTH